jgi:hypothetical protein
MLRRLGFVLLALGVFLSVSCFVVPVSATKGNSPMTHTLPTPSDAIVVQWRTIGGLSIDRSNIADLTIYADGKTVVDPRFSQGNPVESQLEIEQIQELLRFVIDENNFFGFDGSAVEAEINVVLQQRQAQLPEAGAIAIPLVPPYVDAGTTVILIAADGQQQQVHFQGLFVAAQDFPEIEAIQQLRAIELKLLTVAEALANSNRE